MKQARTEGLWSGNQFWNIAVRWREVRFGSIATRATQRQVRPCRLCLRKRK